MNEKFIIIFLFQSASSFFVFFPGKLCISMVRLVAVTSGFAVSIWCGDVETCIVLHCSLSLLDTKRASHGGRDLINAGKLCKEHC